MTLYFCVREPYICIRGNEIRDFIRRVKIENIQPNAKLVTVYLSESLNAAPRKHVCRAGFFRDKLFRSISYVTIFSLIETTTTNQPG